MILKVFRLVPSSGRRYSESFLSEIGEFHYTYADAFHTKPMQLNHEINKTQYT